MILLDDDVAGAEKAEAFAEGKMHVKRDGSFGSIGFGVDFFEIIGTERIVPNGRGGIAGVTRAGTVVARKKVFGDAEFFARLVERWSREGHKVALTATFRRTLARAGALAGRFQ